MQPFSRHKPFLLFRLVVATAIYLVVRVLLRKIEKRINLNLIVEIDKFDISNCFKESQTTILNDLEQYIIRRLLVTAFIIMLLRRC